jgi:hypothetical protein
MKQRGWRDYPLPVWVKDSILTEMRSHALHDALAWPTETRPVPAFSVSEYNKVEGVVQPGRFHVIRAGSMRSYVLRSEKGKWIVEDERGRVEKHVIPAGDYFVAVADAHLFCLWAACDAAAATLLKLKERYTLTHTGERK